MRLPGMMPGQHPSCFTRRTPEEQRAHLLKTIEQALEITADCDDCFFSEGGNSSSSLCDHTGHDEDDHSNRQKQ
jgi:hypothetical protein